MIVNKTKRKRTEASPVFVLTLDYNLAELPSSQHRAGLAGLIMMLQWLKEQEKHEGICELTRLDEFGATLQIDERGLKALFEETYNHVEGERESTKLETTVKSKKVKPYKEIRYREEMVSETGEKKLTSIYVYPDYIPKGAFLSSYDPTANDAGEGIWIGLWRDFVWRVVRKKDQAKNIYRDKKKPATEAEKVWEELTSSKSKASALSGTDLIGARAYNAEQIPFKDKAEQKLLLHFWSYVAQIYIPITTVIDKKTKRPKIEEVGFAVAIPEVARLDTFCRVLPKVLNNREQERKGFRQRPRDCLIDVPAEGALDLFIKLRDRIALSEGARSTGRVVSAIEVFHVSAAGDDVNIKGTARIEPESFRPDEYERVRHNLWNHEFRKQRVLNILNDEREWYANFDKLLSRLPLKLGFDGEYFSHDARESFKAEVKDLEEEWPMNNVDDAPFASRDTEDMDSEASTQAKREPKSSEALVYKVVGRYLDRKLKAKRNLGYVDVITGEADKDEYSKERRKLATDAFYSVKSRTRNDFTEYFANTLCSVSQNMAEDDYVALARELHQNPERIRTLTMLALAARS